MRGGGLSGMVVGVDDVLAELDALAADLAKSLDPSGEA